MEPKLLITAPVPAPAPQNNFGSAGSGSGSSSSSASGSATPFLYSNKICALNCYINSNKIYTFLRLFCLFYFSDWNDKKKSFQYVLIVCQTQVTKNYFYIYSTTYGPLPYTCGPLPNPIGPR